MICAYIEHASAAALYWWHSLQTRAAQLFVFRHCRVYLLATYVFLLLTSFGRRKCKQQQPQQQQQQKPLYLYTLYNVFFVGAS